jgi:hypothetical protein
LEATDAALLLDATTTVFVTPAPKEIFSTRAFPTPGGVELSKFDTFSPVKDPLAPFYAPE